MTRRQKAQVQSKWLLPGPPQVVVPNPETNMNSQKTGGIGCSTTQNVKEAIHRLENETVDMAGNSHPKSGVVIPEVKRRRQGEVLKEVGGTPRGQDMDCDSNDQVDTGPKNGMKAGSRPVWEYEYA
ncbi:hypothetical protein M5689_012799 [Euphorbia peplus]|nr:hypothetical protein M5689_012799 [Euphorbia peplus]